MAYVYRHIRVDKNEPFYIGIGSDKNYRRAYDKSHRNKIWKNIYNKSSIEIEILFQDLSWEQACEKEKELIKLYGRKNYGGTLCNMTIGGDGTIGLIRNDVIERNKKIHTGKIITEETRKKQSESHMGKILSQSHRLNISKVTKGRKLSSIHKKRIGDANKSTNHGNWCGYICQYDTNGNLINVFDTLYNAQNKSGVNYRDISKVCMYYKCKENNLPYHSKKNHKTAGNYIWKRANMDSIYHK